MIVREHVELAPLTSLGVGGPARFFIDADAEQDVAGAAAFARETGLPLRVLGGGTNILVPDAGVDAVVMRISSGACHFEEGEGDTVNLVADAGAPWNTLVDAAASRGLWGIENLAGIPGHAGGALVQNIGAYGAELAETFISAIALDLSRRRRVRIDREAALLGYRTSLFKRRQDLVIYRITLRLSRAGEPRLAYADLVRAKEGGVALSTPAEIADAVRAIRARKFPDRGAGTAGSFFKNPVVGRETLQELRARYPDLPVYPQGGEGAGKVSLAWLLDHALGLRGYAEGQVSLFKRQPLVIVAGEGARSHDVDLFALDVARRVRDALGIEIEREVETFGARAS